MNSPRTISGTEALEPLTAGVAWLDPQFRIAYANPAFAEHTGFGRARTLGQTLATLPPDGARLHELARQVQSEGTGVSFRSIELCAAPGRDTWLDGAITPHAGGVLLELQPAASTASAPRVSESLRGFAHEIRNPLAAISGAAQLLAQRVADGRQRALADLIRVETARLADLSARLLGTRNTLAARAVNVHALLEHIVELLQAEHAPVAIVRDYDPSLPAWHGDPDRLLQALLNLVRNAVEANARRIVLRSRAEAGWRNARGQSVPALRIEVEDDGDGVPASLAHTLFEPMVSGHADGSGLGLALAREIAREHGGELAYQRRGTGSRFVLRLPRRFLLGRSAPCAQPPAPGREQARSHARRP